MKKAIGIIGFGNMGRAIAEYLKPKYTISVFDVDKNKTTGLSKISVAGDIAQLIDGAEVLVLAVKPQDFDNLLKEVRAHLNNQLVISIAAGITTDYIRCFIGEKRIIRAMPNLGAKIGKSVTCICKGASATDDDLAFARELFQQLGEVQDLPEDMMNAATAISGSGPGYYFNAVASRKQEFIQNHKKFHSKFIEELRHAAESLGFDVKTAHFLANWTVVYSDLLLKETKVPPEELRNQVTSKGGTTEAALKVLHSGGTMVDAVKAAVKRAQELSK